VKKKMNAWLETIGVILVAMLGIALGRMFSGLSPAGRWVIFFHFC
jgi:hypothetical protein